jgi:uncharacterized protein
MSVIAVYDCMMYLQAAARPSRVHTTFQLVYSGQVTLCISPDVLAEVKDVLTRPRHAEKFPALTARNIDAFLVHLMRHAKLIETVPQVYTVGRDAKDSKYVDLAVAAQAKYLVSWDHHLLDLMDDQKSEGQDFRSRWPGLRILNPLEFLRASAAGDRAGGV